MSIPKKHPRAVDLVVPAWGDATDPGIDAVRPDVASGN